MDGQQNMEGEVVRSCQEWNYAKCRKIDGTSGYSAQQNKAEPVRQAVSVYMWTWDSKAYRTGKQKEDYLGKGRENLGKGGKEGDQEGVQLM